MGEKFAQLKDENKILVMLAFYSISIGIWENFKQLWLQDNLLNVARISQILSISGLFCIISLILISKGISLKDTKKVIVISLFFKIINLILLSFLNHTGQQIIIEICIILDNVLGNLITISIYPLILTIKRENKLYSKRKLTEYLFKDVGILIGGIIIGKTVAGIVMSYNICLIISMLFSILAYITISQIKTKAKTQEKKVELKQSLVFMVKNKIVRAYFGYIMFSHIAMSTGLGLKMLMLTNLLDFSDAGATGYLLIIGLIADGIGIIALKYLTPKNDYLTVTIKFGIRLWLYVLAFLTNNVVNGLIAITWSILISTAYENVIDAPYINYIPDEYQLKFTNYRYIFQLIGTSIGLYFAGLMYPHRNSLYTWIISIFYAFPNYIIILSSLFKKERD